MTHLRTNFYGNPVRQNELHLRSLSSYLQNTLPVEVPLYSVIVFSDRCFLKVFVPENVAVLRESELLPYLSGYKKYPDVLSQGQVKELCRVLKPLRGDFADRKKHQGELQNASPQCSEVETDILCPWCSQELVIWEVPATGERFCRCRGYRGNGRGCSFRLRMEMKEGALIPLCNECGRAMVERTNRKTGTKFYGCTGYPNCRFTLSKKL